MAAAGIDMQRKRHARLSQRPAVAQDILDPDRIILGHHQKGSTLGSSWSALGGLVFATERTATYNEVPPESDTQRFYRVRKEP